MIMTIFPAFFSTIANRRPFLLWASALLLATAQGSALAAKKDPVVMSFATVGDSRADPDTAQTLQDKRWLQNTRALSRILREIQGQKAQALFFNGDMIMGYTTDKAQRDAQYAYWRGMTAHLLESGTYVVPVPGNHEMQDRYKDEQGKTQKTASLANENNWRDNMGDLILDAARWKTVVGNSITAFDVDNAPAADGPDAIKTKQSQLSFSFDQADNHFIVINTDPVGNDGHAPTHWLAADMAKASARGARHFFVFGHKPAYTYRYKADMKADGFDIYPDNLQAFWQLMEQYHASYFCGHEHIYHIEQPTVASGGKAWQVMVGSGGSPFTAKAKDISRPEDRMYAWAVVKIHASGKVHLDAYGFDEFYGKTRLLKSVDLQ